MADSKTLTDAFGVPLVAGDTVAFVGTFHRSRMHDSRGLRTGVVTGRSPERVRIAFTNAKGETESILRDTRLVAKRALPQEAQ